MSTSLRLPTELGEFLGLPGPQSLLIRGPPGSGKTTLALAMLEAFGGKKILVSGRVSSDELRREFGWLGRDGGESIEIIDTSSASQGAAASARAASKLRELLTGNDATSGGLEKFLWLPAPLQEAWSQASEQGRTLLIVDSWDALVGSYLGGPSPTEVPLPDRSEVERILLERMAGAPIHLVLVLEREEQTQLDYLVNAVVHARTEFNDERLERWLVLRKLRGVRIANAMYPFTLEGGKFDCIMPVRAYASFSNGRAEPEPDRKPGYLWPGSAGFADAFGRLPLGGITLVEMEATVPQSIPYLLFAPSIAQVAGLEGSVLILPDTEATPELLWERVRHTLPQKKFFDHVRFIAAAGTAEGAGNAGAEFGRTIIRLGPDKSGKAPVWQRELGEFVQEGEGRGAPALGLLHTSGIYALADANKVPLGHEMMTGLPSIVQSFMHGKQMHTILVARRGDRLLEAVRPIASSHIQIRTRQGRILLHGTAPWTPTFLLAAGQDHVPYELLRVV